MRANHRHVDLEATPLRALNAMLHRLGPEDEGLHVAVLNPGGRHAIAAGLDAAVTVEVEGHVGYYCAGMNKRARVLVRGHAGTGVAENIMSGEVRVQGDASQSAGASGRGGLVVIEGSASARCGISMKGVDIVVGGDVGAMSAFMAQAGRLVVLGDAGEALGDSLYEARLFVRGRVASLGADCEEKPMTEADRDGLEALIASAGFERRCRPSEFRRYGSARRLYHFHIDNAAAY